MNWCRKSILLLSLTSLGLLAHAGPSEAFTRTIAVSGTSTGAGICQIIIESFGLKGGGSSLAPITINVSIPSGSTASNSATLIRNDVDAALPVDYVVTVVGGTNVQIVRSPGTFNMTINNGVSGQSIAEVLSPSTPIINDTLALVLAALLALAASLLLIRRERRGES
jgi:hypothetical protein